jgi:hypothetical protein
LRSGELKDPHSLPSFVRQTAVKNQHLSSAHFDRVLYRPRKRMQSIVSRQKGLKRKLCGGLYEA